VRALTGKDTDRLPEEQRRGISIDLGYAPLELPDGRRVSVVDVPGHERFVRTMVAGATGIDLFLLVIDAGEGSRPQTHEHLAVLRLLGVERGVVAVTKSDTVDLETLDLALAEARELAPGADVVAVSAKTGSGLEDLRAALARIGDTIEARPSSRPTRLFVDRSFTLRGIGTVVTGTLWSGTVGAGDALRLLPADVEIRVRGVHVHDSPVARAEAGQRVALNVTGLERSEVRRGDAIVAPGAYPVSYRLDVVLDELEPIVDGARISVHHGTSRAPARVARVGERFAQLRLDAPVMAARGDRVVLRTGTTVGGGLVLDPAPPRHRDNERMGWLERGDVAATVDAPVHLAALRHVLEGELQGVERAGPWAFSSAWLARLEGEIRTQIDASDPIDPGVPAPVEPWAGEILPLLPFERRGAKLYLPGAQASLGARESEAQRLLAMLDAAGVSASRVQDPELARFLESRGELVRLGDGFAIGAGGYEAAKDALVRECREAGEITLSRFRDLLGTGRRDAQLLLERFDQDGLTRRIGDKRILRRAARVDAGTS
jgi:selenocysteine-specific elongation factor